MLPLVEDEHHTTVVATFFCPWIYIHTYTCVYMCKWLSWPFLVYRYIYIYVTVVSSVTDVHIHTHHTAVVTKLTWRYTHMVVQNDIIALDGTAERERERRQIYIV